MPYNPGITYDTKSLSEGISNAGNELSQGLREMKANSLMASNAVARFDAAVAADPSILQSLHDEKAPSGVVGAWSARKKGGVNVQQASMLAQYADTFTNTKRAMLERDYLNSQINDVTAQARGRDFNNNINLSAMNMARARRGLPPLDSNGAAMQASAPKPPPQPPSNVSSFSAPPPSNIQQFSQPGIGGGNGQGGVPYGNSFIPQVAPQQPAPSQQQNTGDYVPARGGPMPDFADAQDSIIGQTGMRGEAKDIIAAHTELFNEWARVNNIDPAKVEATRDGVRGFYTINKNDGMTIKDPATGKPVWQPAAPTEKENVNAANQEERLARTKSSVEWVNNTLAQGEKAVSALYQLNAVKGALDDILKSGQTTGALSGYKAKVQNLAKTLGVDLGSPDGVIKLNARVGPLVAAQIKDLTPRMTNQELAMFASYNANAEHPISANFDILNGLAQVHKRDLEMAKMANRMRADGKSDVDIHNETLKYKLDHEIEQAKNWNPDDELGVAQPTEVKYDSNGNAWTKVNGKVVPYNK